MVLKATSIMFASQMATTVILFLRNILVARLISVEDFGIAATFSILFAVIETASNVGANKMVVQDRDGEDPRFQDTLHGMQVVRGVLSALLMFAVAGPYARFVNTPDLVWAYQLMAVIPLARSFLHLDMFRVQREMNFTPFAINVVASPVLSFVAIGGIYLIYPDFRIMLGAIITQQLAQVVLSHALAKRRFALAWDMAYVRRALSFGLPLLMNGVLAMIILQGERMMVANQLDLTTLGWFSAAFLLATAPTRILVNTASSLFLPKLSKVQDDRAAFNAQAVLSLEVNLYLGLWMAVGLSVAGPLLLVGFFGPDYAPGAAVLVILGMGQAVRVARTGCNTIAMAAGQTLSLLHMSLVRVLGVGAAFWVLVQGQGVEAVALVALAFELAALAVGLMLNTLQQKVPVQRTFLGLAVFLAMLAIIYADLTLFRPMEDAGLWDYLHWAQLGLMATATLALLAMPRTLSWGLQVSGLRSKLSKGSGA